MSWWKCKILALGMLLALIGCFGKAEPQPVVIGHVSTLNGPGDRAARGIRLAVEEVERDPSKGPGRPIVVRHTDARGVLEAFESEGVRLVAVNRAVALLGGTSAAEVERLERAQVPVVAPAGMHARALGELAFLTGLSPGFQGQVLARFAAQDRAATTAAVLADERREDALQLAEAFVRAFPAAVHKQQPMARVPQPAVWRYGKSSRIEELAARVHEGKPDVLLVAGSAVDLRDLLAVLRQPGLPVLWGRADGESVPPADSLVSNPVFQTTAFVSDADTPRAKAFLENYRKAFSEEPDVDAALAYEGALLLFEALRQVNDSGGSQLTEKLAGLKDFPGLTGPLSFVAEHQVRRPAFVVRLENGQRRTVQRFDPEP